MAIRAVISVKRLVAEVSIAEAPVDHAFTVDYARPEANIHYQLAEATNIYVDPDSKNRWFYEELPISDVYVNVFSTSKADAITVTETVDVSAGLNRSENLTNTDTFSRQVDFLRTPVEPKTATDSYQSLFTKPRADTFAVGDVSSPTAHKGILEILYGQQEGPNFISDYVDASYFASDYVGRGLPKIDFTKLTEDTAAATDQLQPFELSKSLADSATFSDLITGITYTKQLTDTVDATDDFYGAANADDDQTMSFVTSRSEVISVGDLVSPQAEKGLGENLSTSDSGSLRMTDYCDVNYFADSYIGTSATF